MHLNLSHEVISLTHNKIEIPQPGHWFKDLAGNPMWIKPHVVIKWVPKTT